MKHFTFDRHYFVSSVYDTFYLSLRLIFFSAGLSHWGSWSPVQEAFTFIHLAIHAIRIYWQPNMHQAQ